MATKKNIDKLNKIKDQARQMVAEGMAIIDAAKKLKQPYSTVQYWIKSDKNRIPPKEIKAMAQTSVMIESRIQSAHPFDAKLFEQHKTELSEIQFHLNASAVSGALGSRNLMAIYSAQSALIDPDNLQDAGESERLNNVMKTAQAANAGAYQGLKLLEAAAKLPPAEVENGYKIIGGLPSWKK